MGFPPRESDEPEMSEAALLEGYKSGVPRAFEVLWTRHETQFRRRAWKKCFQNPEDVDEALQETSARLLEEKNRKFYDVSEKWVKWGFVHLHRSIIDLHRRRARLVTKDPADLPDTIAPADAHDPEFKQALDQCLAALPEREREVLIWVFLDGKTQNELGARWGVVSSVVSKTKTSALAHLRDRLTRKGYGES
jgi:RNA polymerase sigma factor (sigma-70 family)